MEREVISVFLPQKLLSKEDPKLPRNCGALLHWQSGVAVKRGLRLEAHIVGFRKQAFKREHG